MKDKISNLINDINESIEWVKNNRPGDYEQRFLQLVDQRRKLKKIAVANEDNPAIAAYGESQVGKSFLMSNMLQKEVTNADGTKTIKQFEVMANGKPYNFINEMNPIGNGTEATGVVTRFSSFSRNKERYSEKYPVLMKTLSVADITIILSDGYFKDLIDPETGSREDINKKAEEIVAKYNGAPVATDAAITADDILDMKQYFSKHLLPGAGQFKQSSFFDKLAFVIDRIPFDDYDDVFSYLWNGETEMTKLYKQLLGILKRLKLQKLVYLPIEAVLHGGRSADTILSVDCLNGLDDASFSFHTNAFLRDGNSFVDCGRFTKSEISAVCAEVVYRIEDDFLDGARNYALAADALGLQPEFAITPEVEKTLPKEVKYDMLKNTDLFDFPGARSRLNIPVSQLGKKTDNNGQDVSNIIKVLLRGKVAYLFNKYCEDLSINILLYCHHSLQTNVSDLWTLINDWVNNFVGKSPESRADFIKSLDGESPLFYIATKFNMDMAEDQNETANSRTAIDDRWNKRFTKVLYNQCLGGTIVDWVNNWTSKGNGFKNSYLLRDFKYSGTHGSGLYDGFREKGVETKPLINNKYMATMRDSFCESKDVSKFFDNPELSWDVAATMNNDGSLYIIDNLSKVASRIQLAREKRWQSNIQDIALECHNIMQGYYISTDVDKILDAHIRKAKSIMRELDFVCNDDNYYFGHLIEALQISEADCYREVHKQIQALSFDSKPDNWHDYELIIMSCRNAGHPIDKAKDASEKWQALIDTYTFANQHEAEEYLNRRNVDVDKLFGGKQSVKRYSAIIATAVYEKWIGHIKSVDFIGSISGDGSFDPSVMSELVECFKDTSEALGLKKVMGEAIAEFTDTLLTIHEVNEGLIADTLASNINGFVLDFGYSYLSSEDKENARHTCEVRNLPAFNYIERQEPPARDENYLSELFLKMATEPTALQPSFEENYNKWREYMFIAFVAHLEVPAGFDKAANDKIFTILEKMDKCLHESA